MSFPQLTVMQLLPALEMGGVERSALEIAQALVQAGHRSIVVSAGGRLVAGLVAGGSTHEILPIGQKSWRVLFRVRALRRLIQRYRPDIVHARSRLPAWVGRCALRGLRDFRPHWVTTVHGLNHPSRYSAVMASGERVICVSETVRRHVLRHYPSTDESKLVVIPRGVDPQAWPHGYRPSPEWQQAFLQQFPQWVGKPLLTLPGRGTRLKNHADAIRAVAWLKSHYQTEVGLCLLGAQEAQRADYVAELNRLAQELGVASQVVATPPRLDAREFYAVSKAVLQPSAKPEAFGRTVVEALALGVPVIGYDHGGVGEILAVAFPQGRTEPGDWQGMARRIDTILRQPPAIQPLPGYELQRMQAQTLGLYRELTQARHAENVKPLT